MCGSAATKEDVENLCRAVRMDVGTVFLPWRWNKDAAEVLRSKGCMRRMNHDKDSLAPTQPQSFKEAHEAGVVGFAESEAVTHVIMPMAVELSRFMVVARVQTACISTVDVVSLYDAKCWPVGHLTK